MNALSRIIEHLQPSRSRRRVHDCKQTFTPRSHISWPLDSDTRNQIIADGGSVQNVSGLDDRTRQLQDGVETVKK